MVPLARVGKEAPDFEATAYIPGQGFQTRETFRLSWQMGCPLFLPR
jgi:hypothetical protein